VVEFAQFLVERGYLVVSTGGTLRVLMKAGVPAIDISDLTGVPEMLGGLVKTITHHVHAGLLADLTNPDHVAELQLHNITPIDLVYFHLYDIQSAVAEPGATLESVRVNTDMGGVAAMRSAAKGGRLVVSHPAQLEWVMQMMGDNQARNPVFRLQLIVAALDEVSAHQNASRTAHYKELMLMRVLAE